MHHECRAPPLQGVCEGSESWQHRCRPSCLFAREGSSPAAAHRHWVEVVEQVEEREGQVGRVLVVEVRAGG
jgi:hypothetical protein